MTLLHKSIQETIVVMLYVIQHVMRASAYIQYIDTSPQMQWNHVQGKHSSIDIKVDYHTHTVYCMECVTAHVPRKSYD